MKINLKINKKKFSLEVKKLSFIGKLVGLMFSRREKAQALLFDFGKSVRAPIHSWFVFFEFYAVWLDGKNNVLEIQKIRPWKCLIRPKRKFVKLIEVPGNDRYKNILEFPTIIRKV